ncbi:MAG: DNA polymerase I [Candidatus Sungbacteria bacterium]|uniref:DNA-directed DNA polymerase n=1 Tax=Candidatus Sungiibacteriota bacterium TaxID=2750080 RepID=A0A9D6LQU7_9BACT|nr:DNA polymerase I [Candidatus Sungbacteria bacterium]
MPAKKSAKNKKKILVLLDAHAIIHRAFHALPTLTNTKGEPTGAIYGFANILLRILDELKPDYLAAAFDMAGPTFRHIAYERYKAQRPKAPDALIGQFAGVRRLTKAFGIPVLEKESFEADDIIGTIADQVAHKEKNIEVVIVTGDLDTLQLIQKNVRVYTMRKGMTDTVIYDEKAVRERYGLKPDQLTDFKGLRGDPSDNIPGVHGIGEKTASDLLKKYGTIEKLYTSLTKAKISAGIKEKLAKEKEEALFSKSLATINREVPIVLKLKDAEWHGPHGIDEVGKLFREFGFTSLMRRLGYIQSEEKAKIKQAGGLFEVKVESKEVADLAGDENLSREQEVGFYIHEPDAYLAIKSGLFRIPESFPPNKLKTFVEQDRKRTFFGEKEILRRSQSFFGYPDDFDILIALYLLKAGERVYSIDRAAREAGIPASDIVAFRHGFKIREALCERLKERELWKVFSEIEMPMVPILAEVEARGMKIDTAFLKTLSNETAKTLNDYEKKIYKLAGREFNINSPKQVAEVLFDDLKLEPKGLRKTEGGAISTDASELAKIKNTHPIIAAILDYREVAKLKSTYIDALPELVGEDGALHTTFSQTIAATGRLSSSNPNLQNIPTRTEFGRIIRRAFVAGQGYELVSFDYSQIELRVAAAMAGDEKMKEAFIAGRDIHALTAMEVNHVSTLAEVTPEMRYAAKALNFGVLYGMGSRAFSESAGVPLADAKRFMEEYFKNFPKIREFMNRTLDQARRKGYVETMLGRRRYIPEINSPNWRLRAEAERMAMNAPIQGTATGDIVKLAMINVDKYFKALPKDTAHILMQVHDDILCEIKSDKVSTVAPRVKGIMERVYDIGVPIVVDVKVGPNWGEMKSLSK